MLIFISLLFLFLESCSLSYSSTSNKYISIHLPNRECVLEYLLCVSHCPEGSPITHVPPITHVYPSQAAGGEGGGDILTSS